MLVLSRKVGEEILIGESIRVQVLEIRGNRVKLGLTAPNEVRFARLEVARTGALEPSVVCGTAKSCS